MALQNRMSRELRSLEAEPPEGVSAWPVANSITSLKAQIQGPQNTVYEDALFELQITIPERYPFEPPKVVFITPVYHPNIDPSGRICLDMLKPKPSGVWAPSLNICTVLAGVRQLLKEPNPSDPLMVDITEEYLHNRALFDMKARQMVANQASGSSRRQHVDGEQQKHHEQQQQQQIEQQQQNEAYQEQQQEQKRCGHDEQKTHNSRRARSRSRSPERPIRPAGQQRDAEAGGSGQRLSSRSRSPAQRQGL